ncbi:LamB/YcsF family protein [Alkalihalobacillus pseudalcaliphilus]|uniref:LamB/YcsF family protein n=1 Tax=Alkalihalobacillus pseudalcaliphilus TaxID=79884 RepID=UPI00064DF422|nr:5-oxoprolinase subunit PxpA [Alkalihalobacillus pseudalcaliphilus]KMK77441.1 LamB/YcsF family protein [Alkalihalobacillus pseudalcaliphilus]
MHIDLNCDLGESYGAFSIGQDEEIIPYVTSVNIACGFHAGDPSVMAKTIQRAQKYGTAIGAHPGYQDLQGFGRRFIPMEKDELFHMLVYQIGALQGLCLAYGATLRHVKPHGALYNVAAVQPDIAETIAQAVRVVNPALILYGLSGSELVRAGERAGLKVAHEVFADRSYQRNGTLTPRTEADAIITDKHLAIERVLQFINEGTTMSLTGESIPMKADTVCIHGDHPQALPFVMDLHERLKREGIMTRSLESQHG